MDPLTLPLDYSAIERIIPHRYPFLLVDRITELEPDKRIVGIKNVSLNERYLSRQPGVPPALPPTRATPSSWPMRLRSRFTRASISRMSPGRTG